MANGIAVLMYHELEMPGRTLCQTDPGYRRYIVSAAAFETQLRHLKSLGYSGISVGRLLEGIQPKQVVLTFDDGCETDVKVAAPVLHDLGFNATFYVTVGFLGRPGYMTESQLRDLSSCGFEIGCHSMTHPYLPGLDSDGLKLEISAAKNKLERILGKTVDHFSCPGGRFNARVLDTVREAGYSSCATSRPQLYSGPEGRYLIGRIPVMRNTSIKQVQDLWEGRGIWRLALGQHSRQAVQSLLGDRVYDSLRSTWLSRSE